MDEQKPRTVAIIPARGGSKQVPRKNLQRVGGVPLVERAVRAAAAASGIDLVVVSTDDDEIAAVATAAGARVIRRPAELAGDTATSESAILHALDELEARGDSVGIVAFLQATSPFIPSDALAAAVEEIRADRADSVFAAHETYGFLWREDDRGDAVAINHEAAHRPRRQDREPHHLETGAFYVFRARASARAGIASSAGPASPRCRNGQRSRSMMRISSASSVHSLRCMKFPAPSRSAPS